MIAILAGTGRLPSHACKALLQAHKNFLVIALFPADNFEELKSLLPPSVPLIQQPFYKAQAVLNLLKQHNVTEILFIGKVDKQNLLKKFKFDWLAIKLLATLITKNDAAIMNKVAEVLQKHNITIISQQAVLKELFIKPGVLTGTLTPKLEANIRYGLATAQQMAACDIGQTVVVKDNMIIAVEAIEGTDACIRRGIELGKKNVIVCKAARENHDIKFDLPTIGPKTLIGIQEGEIEAIAWQSSHTFIADQEAFVERAKELGITLVSV